MAVKKKRSTSASTGKSPARKTRGASRKPAAAAGKRAAAKAPARSTAKASAGKTTARARSKTTAARASAPAKRSAAGSRASPPAKAGAGAGKPASASAPRQSQAKPAQPQQGRPPPRRGSGGAVTGTVGLIHGIPPYRPQPGETYMNDRQRDHFRNILLAWKRELMEGVDRTVHHMQDEASNFPDPNDRATQESEFGLELRTRDRERKLLKKIDSALERIEDGSYGYCEETGDEIGLKRLEARPVATLSVEAQERREVAERQYRDREDGF
ncbi:MAG: RNA polymerase-binding protein DksA [Gammaproteobacteria bacterium]|nr:RNA polymerase-binding protein DksA [Gammaproteobacteria bacterium]